MRIPIFLWITICLVLAKKYVDALRAKNSETQQKVIDVSKDTSDATNTEGKEVEMKKIEEKTKEKAEGKTEPKVEETIEPKVEEKTEKKTEEKTKTNTEVNNEFTTATTELEPLGAYKEKKDNTDKEQEANKQTVDIEKTQAETIDNKEPAETSNDTFPKKETNNGNPKKASLQNFMSENDKIEKTKDVNLKEPQLSDDEFETAKNVCNKVVINNEAYQSFCSLTEVFNMLETLKETNKKLFDEITNKNYEVDTTSFNLEAMKDQKDIKVFKEEDIHNPNVSALFVFAKLCLGGIPLACGNILKYETATDYNETKNISEKASLKNEKNERANSENELNFDDELWDAYRSRESVYDLTNETTETEAKKKS